jgi:RNA polymerase sigma-70 factor (ECF subfamily)
MTTDHDLFSSWMQDHLGVIHRISRAFADPADQPDLLQELLLSVWRAAPAFRGESEPATFIYRVAHNRAITWRRRALGHRRRTLDVEREWALTPQPEDEATGVLLDRIYAAIRTLGPIDRSLILLALEGMSYRDMSRIHALSETNIGARLSRARGRISALVKEDDHGL